MSKPQMHRLFKGYIRFNPPLLFPQTGTYAIFYPLFAGAGGGNLCG